MGNKNVLSCLLKDGKEVKEVNAVIFVSEMTYYVSSGTLNPTHSLTNAVTLVGRLFHARATVTRNDRSPMVLSRDCGTIRRGQV